MRKILSQRLSFTPLCKFILLVMVGLFASDVFADQPHNWQFGFQEAATPVMERVNDIHNFILFIIGAVGVLVTALLTIVIFRFREKKNPNPSKVTHNTMLEIVWTLVPCLLVISIAIPSLRLLYFMDKTEQPELTVKVVGHQWYWRYVYPEHEFEFESRMIPDDQIDKSKGQLRLLSVDNALVVPVGTNVRVLTTAEDVLHSFAVPSFGVKKDTVPGRLNETWFRVNKEGVYYGQCSELCGMQHGFMPIEIRVVSKDQFKTWLVEAKNKFA